MRVSIPTPESKLDLLGGRLDLLGERLPTRSSYSPFVKSPAWPCHVYVSVYLGWHCVTESLLFEVLPKFFHFTSPLLVAVACC